ncbi:MAG: hypothetical protein JWM05_2890 [Acidimicrobiales bacterium]|nr:hypothetical protein [Acidimicrobiales bacterium]
MKIKLKPARIAVAAIGLAAFGTASAASLGGLTSTSVGSNDTVVAACDTDGVAIAYTTAYSASASQYQVTAVNLSGIAAGCLNQTASVTVKGAGGTSLASGTSTIAGTTDSITLSAAVSAQSMVGASIVISG